MNRLLRVSVAVIALCIAAAASHPSLAQSRSCSLAKGSFYSLDGVIFPGEMRYCSDGQVSDLTTGAGAPKTGEVLLYDVRRAQQRISIIMRGVPNRPYVVRDSEPYGDYVVPLLPHDDLRWSNVKYTLPFSPTKIYSISDKHQMYGFGDFVNIVNGDANAYPINSRSIIISIDGTAFISKRGWLGVLSDYAPSSVPRYADVVYIQKDEFPIVRRRAIIPYYKVSQISSQWQRARAVNPLLSDEVPTSQLSKYVMVYAAAATLAVIYYRSGLANMLYDMCLNSANNVAIDGTCTRDPRLDLVPHP